MSSATAAAARIPNCHPSLERAGEEDRSAEDRADRRRPGAVKERPRALVVPQLLEATPAEEDERERGGERDERGEQATGEAVGRVADCGDGRDDGAGGDLAEGDRVQKLPVAHPVVGVDGVTLHQRDDHETAAERERPDLERRPGQRADPAHGHGRG